LIAIPFGHYLSSVGYTISYSYSMKRTGKRQNRTCRGRRRSLWQWLLPLWTVSQ